MRLAALASVNLGVYLLYTKAIRKAKQGRVEGTFHERGATAYDAIVVDSYRNYIGVNKEE